MGDDADAVRRVSGRLYGLLLLSAFVLYGVGAGLPRQTGGLVLVLLNSGAAVALGLVGLHALGARRRALGAAYFGARCVEAALLACGGVAGARGFDGANGTLYLAGMVVLSACSVPFCDALRDAALVPEWLGIWGVIAYALFAVACAAQLATGRNIALAGGVPGALFEIVAGAYLLAFGFGRRTRERLPLLANS